MSFGPASYADQLQHKALPSEQVIQNVSRIPDEYPFRPDHSIVIQCTPDMARNPQYQPPSSRGPSLSPFWTNPDSKDIPSYAAVDPEDNEVAGLISAAPGRVWQYMAGHLTKIHSPINWSYFEKIDHVKVPAFWYRIMNVHQLQHALASVSDKMLSQDGWTDMDPHDFSPELGQTFDTSLLESS